MKEISATFWVLMWFVGLVLAKGWISTTVAVLFPPWAVYLVVEAVMHGLGIV